jgi:aspartyl-tRNA(Asn)/glutamyl-tRNA(Gln) amidotransferase subunit B
MEDGAFRCDANISIRAKDGSFVGPKVEIKNMNSFRSVERALRYEEQRQRKAVQEGEALVQETRGWVEAQGVTVSQRSKEMAHDYRYFPEPDLPPIRMTADRVEGIRATLPELPLDREHRFVAEYGISAADAALLTGEKPVAEVFEEAISGAKDPSFAQAAANWIVNDIMGLARARSMRAEELPLAASQIRELVTMVMDKSLTGRAAKDLLAQLEPDESPKAAAERLDLLAVDNDDEVRAAAEAAIEAQPAAVADYRSGKQAAIGRLIGETMKRTGGRANPDAVRAALLELLSSDA